MQKVDLDKLSDSELYAFASRFRECGDIHPAQLDYALDRRAFLWAKAKRDKVLTAYYGAALRSHLQRMRPDLRWRLP